MAIPIPITMAIPNLRVKLALSMFEWTEYMDIIMDSSDSEKLRTFSTLKSNEERVKFFIDDGDIR